MKEQYKLSSLLALIAMVVAPKTFASAIPPYNMPYGVTPLSHAIYDLHMLTFYICCGIGVVVYSVLFYSLVKFRKSKGAKPANFHENLAIEIIWTAVPFLILLVLAIPATLVLIKIHNTDHPNINVKVVGYQWRWQYEYLDDGIQFFSNMSTTQAEIHGETEKSPWFLLDVDNPLVLPINQKVRLLITANDVIHSWWVPELGIKQDAIPGYVNENWVYITQPGTYRGQCGELCGAYHGFMPIVVKAVTQAEYSAWIQAHSPRRAHAALSTSNATPTKSASLRRA